MEHKVVSYLRCSTKGQHLSGLGIEAQRTYVSDYCKRTGSNVVREFVEVESGKNCDRAVLKQAIAFSKRSKATLVIAKIDRLARNVAFVANLMETSVKFEACDIAGANNMTIHVMAAVAQNEAEAISTRTKDALQAAKAKGTLLGSHNPTARALTAEARAKGQARSAKVNRAKAVAEYADLAPSMVAMRNKGMTLQQIADQLNEAGEMTRTGASWSATQVSRVLARASF